MTPNERDEEKTDIFWLTTSNLLKCLHAQFGAKNNPTYSYSRKKSWLYQSARVMGCHNNLICAGTKKNPSKM